MMIATGISVFTFFTAAMAAVALGGEADRPCGFRIAPCPTGQTCSHLDATCTRGENCAGVCREAMAAATPEPTVTEVVPTITNTKETTEKATPTRQSCGGFRTEPAPCPEGQVCIDDPDRHGCGLACDVPGICVEPTFCGGFAGVKCEGEGMRCVDDPRDDCDPEDGGADCGGICV